MPQRREASQGGANPSTLNTPPHFLHDLRHTFAALPERPAVLYRGQTITYGELEQVATCAAGWLQRAGVESGDRVVLFTGDKLPFLVSQLGATFAGAVPLPLNPRFTREEMRYYLTDSGARAIIAGGDQIALATELAAQLPQPPVVLADAEALTADATTCRQPDLTAESPCLILYSSGTTGWPKGVVHSHGNVGSALRGLGACWRMNSDDIVVNTLPLFHIHGLAFATHLTWLAGGCVRVEDDFKVGAAMKAIAESTVFMAVPPMYYRLLDDPSFRETARTWKSTRLFTCGSAPIRTEVLPALQEIVQHPIINRYGMTESYVIASLPLDGPWPDGSVGLPIDGVSVRVTRDDGSTADAGEVGAVHVKGPNLFRQYWNKPDATAAAFKDGWFDTSDLGMLDVNGMLTLVGRKNDLIITSGYNVYPQVVERVLGDCPGVRECAVLGVNDAARGERVAAAIVRTAPTWDEAAFRAWWSDRLVHYQQPKTLLFVEELPKNSLGKVLRRELRERMEK